MAKQLNVNLSFTADTAAAKQQILDLQNSLNQIAKSPAKASNLFDDAPIRKASQAALELQQHLRNAVNVDTGKLDLSRFSTSLKASGQSLSQYTQTLMSVGPTGQQAFLQLAKAIATADVPITRVNAKLAQFGTTLKNTARWQISSSILHGFMGALQSAYGYAQDLNASLNDIRIVTGQSVDQMAAFAEKANRAAKALSTTTTEYTNASLIFYQQGLSDDEVAARTEVTVKMANAAGESAQKISDQLTAVWNNFYDGSKSLEYYADVMTALGAATASSTDEIAGGLEKFAAIGETIGLSYEYAASALATITSNTRQSEEVVGTALKTIFARIQGLELGDTLEDGLNLNKYSEALSKVGISIFDSQGELKKMDNILNEMAATWDTLNKGQQTALAQTVAGVRQYTQLIALMENWNNGDSDSMTANLNTAYNSEGALQEQADIYAESWEAAQDRVQAAAENIYDSLINDEFFIDLLNGFEKVLTGVGGFIDGLGGLKGIIGIIGSVFLTNFAQKMPEALTNLRQNMMVFTGQSKKVMTEMQNELAVDLAVKRADPGLSESYKLQLEGISKVNEMKQKLSVASKHLTTQERNEYEMKIKNVEAMYEEAAALAEKKKAAEEAERAASKTAGQTATRSANKVFDDFNSQQNKVSALTEKAGASDESSEKYANALETAKQKAVELEMQIEQVKEAYKLTAEEVNVLIGTNTDQSLLADTQKKIADQVNVTKKAFTDQIKQRSNLEGISVSVKGQAKAWSEVAKQIKQASSGGKEVKNVSKYVDETKQKMRQYLNVLQDLAKNNGIPLSTKMIESMAKEIDSMDADNMEAVTGKFEKFANVVSGKAEASITKLDGSIDELRSDMSAMQFDENEIKELEIAAENAATSTQDLSNSMSNIGGIADEGVQGTFKMSVALTQFSSMAMSVSSLITSISSAIKVFGDEGASGFEKVGAAISVLMPLMTTYNALQELSTTLSKKDSIAKFASTTGMKLMTALFPGMIAGKTGETGAVGANTVAWYANPIMWIALIIVGVIAALAALVAIIASVSKALADAYNADAIAAERAEKAANELAAAYEEAKSSYEEMIAAMDKYQSARDALSELTKGTQEYSQALREANQAALELIDNYGEYLNSDDWEWKDGQLIIDETALENAKREKGKEVDAAYGASQMGAVKAKETKIKADQTEFSRGYIDDGTYAALALAIHQLSVSSLVLAPMVPMIDTALASVGVVLAGQEALYTKAVNTVMDLYNSGNKNILDNKEELAKVLAEYGIHSQHIVDALYDNREALLELGQRYDAAIEQAKLIAEEQARNYIDQEFGTSSYSQDLIKLAGQEFYTENEKIYNELLKQYDSKSGLKSGAQTYFDQSGISSQTGFKIEDVSDGMVKYSVVDENGERQEKEISAEFIASSLAATEAQNALANSCNLLIDSFSALDAKIIQARNSNNEDDQIKAEGMKEFLATGNTASLSKEQVEALSGMSNEELIKYLDGIGINEETVGQLGYEDIDALIESMNLSNIKSQWDDVTEGTQINNMEGSDTLSLTGAQNIKDNLDEITRFFKDSANQVKQDWTNLTNDVVGQLDEASQADFWEQLGNIEDFQNGESWDLLLKNLKETGELTESEAEALELYINEAKKAVQATEDLNFDQMAKDIQSLVDVMDTISEGTRDISNEQFEALEAQGIDTSQFAKTIDGWRYLGETGDIVNEIAKGIETKFVEARSNFNGMKDQVLQIMDNLNAAQEAAAASREAANAAQKQAEEDALEQYKSQAIIAAVFQNIKNTIVEKIKSVWEKICEVCLKVYDFFAKIWNAVGAGLRDAWDKVATVIEKVVNGIIDMGAKLAEFLGFDTSGWKKIALDRAQFTPVKTAEEIEAEMLAKDLETKVAAVEENLDDLCNGIEASADYLSKEELLTEKSKVQKERDDFQAQYDAIKDDPTKKAQADALAKLIAAWDQQLASYDKALQSKQIGEIIGEDLDVKEVEAYADTLAKTNENLKDNKEEALQVAAAHAKMSRGIETLSNSYEGWDKAMKSGNLQEQTKAVGEMKNALSDISGIDASQISDDFVKNATTMNLMEQAAEGNTEALNKLIALLTQEYIANVGINNEQFNGDVAGLKEQLNSLLTQFQTQDLEVGTALDTSGYAQQMTELMAAAGTDIETINNILSGMGFTPEISYVDIPVKDYTEMKQKGETTYTDPITGETYTAVLDTSLSADQNGMVSVPVINGKKTTYNGPPSAQVTSTVKDKGNGSKSEPKKVEPTKKDDLIERYKETEDSINDVRDAYEDATKAADRLYGAGRIAAMMKANKELQKETELLKKKRKEAEAYLKLDKVALNKAASDVGVNLKYDENGNIINYTEELDKLATAHEQRAAELNAKPGGPSEEEVEKFEEEKEKIDALTEAMEKYEDTRQTIRDTDNEIQDKYYEWQDNNYEMWSHSLEVSLDITGDAKELLDALLSRTEGDFFKQAEGLSLMYGQLALTNTEMGIYVGHLGMLGGLMATDSISPKDFIDGLNKIQEGAMNAAAALYELDQQMIEYYGNALSMAREEIDTYTDRMEHCSSVLEHYISLIDLMGHQQDYKTHGVILAGRVDTIANELEVIQEEAEYMMQEAESKKRLLNTVGLIPGAADVLKQQYRDALAAASETQEEFLSKAEEYAEALNAQLENTLNQYGQELEAALTGGKGFELMTSEMEHMVSLQEDYLTETNKIYETEKLMNKAQQDIDKTTNTVAKRRLKQFIEETNLLKEKTDLSKFELDIQQAKYELLLAEIALEEAQKNKTQVRLQRDANGNFGYVYTAEAEEIAKTEQELADKRNELYNISLEGINNYAEKTIQLQQEMFDKLREMEEGFHNGEYASWEAYQAARSEVTEYYYKRIGQTSEIFNIAMQQDSKATADSWGKDYKDIIDSSKEWQTEVTKHINKVDTVFSTWVSTMDVLAQQTGTSMEQLADSVESVTDESEELLHTLVDTGGVLDQIKVEMGLVSALTTLYASLRWAVLAAAAAYTALATALMFVSAASAMAAGVGAILDSDAVSGAVDTVGNVISDAASQSSSGTKSSNSSSSSGNSSSSSSKTVKAKNGAQIFESSTDTKGVNPYFDSNTNYTVIGDYGDRVAVRVEGANSGTTGYFNKKDLIGMATGGYTGEWGPYGKLAMLHEKELVLNAHDTDNFLTSMELLDNIISTIDLHAANQQIGGALSSPAVGNTGSETLEQQVTIEANFPNVSSRIEIEEAFSTLINRASQYANRK